MLYCLTKRCVQRMMPSLKLGKMSFDRHMALLFYFCLRLKI